MDLDLSGSRKKKSEAAGLFMTTLGGADAESVSLREGSKVVGVARKQGEEEEKSRCLLLLEL